VIERVGVIKVECGALFEREVSLAVVVGILAQHRGSQRARASLLGKSLLKEAQQQTLAGASRARDSDE
jgi:hypothetical protein